MTRRPGSSISRGSFIARQAAMMHVRADPAENSRNATALPPHLVYDARSPSGHRRVLRGNPGLLLSRFRIADVPLSIEHRHAWNDARCPRSALDAIVGLPY